MSSVSQLKRSRSAVDQEIGFFGFKENPFSLSPDCDKPVDRVEITYSSFKVKDEQALADLVNGDEVLISYLE